MEGIIEFLVSDAFRNILLFVIILTVGSAGDRIIKTLREIQEENGGLKWRLIYIQKEY